MNNLKYQMLLNKLTFAHIITYVDLSYVYTSFDLLKA